MFTIISALKYELEYLIQKIAPHGKSRIESGSLYVSPAVHFLRTGIGAAQAQKVLSAYLDQFHPQRIINIGTAGALSDEAQAGQIFSVVKVKNENNHKTLHLSTLKDLKNSAIASLVTVKKPVLEEEYRNSLFREYRTELADMEGYYLAGISARYNIPFYSVKIVTDSANQNTKDDFLMNYKKCSDLLGETIFDHLF